MMAGKQPDSIIAGRRNIEISGKRGQLQGAGHAAIIGLGQSGLATAVFLSRLGLDVDVYDSSDSPALREQLTNLLPEVELHCGSLAVENWRDDSLLVVSPGVPLSHPDLAPLLVSGVRPVGDIELFAQCVASPVIAITGSNGKSTVTALVGEILEHAGLRVAVGGNIGVPVLELLDDKQKDIYVLELSSFQLETTWSLKTLIAVVLNVAVDHMDRYKDMDEYIASKLKVYHGSATALVNTDEPNISQRLKVEKEQISFSASATENERDYGLSEIGGISYLCRGDVKLVSADELHLSGKHNHLNVLAAWALASKAGVTDERIKAAVIKFKGLPHRMELLRKQADVTWINDSKGTNVGATVAALCGISAPVILIAGGVAKDADFSPLCAAAEKDVKVAILIGRDAIKIQNALESTVTTSMATDMSDAVKQASFLAKRGDVVLLSPACASFDMYQNFEQRGDDFRRCVGELV